jgi:hypothetical protein
MENTTNFVKDLIRLKTKINNTQTINKEKYIQRLILVSKISKLYELLKKLPAEYSLSTIDDMINHVKTQSHISINDPLFNNSSDDSDDIKDNTIFEMINEPDEDYFDEENEDEPNEDILKEIKKDLTEEPTKKHEKQEKPEEIKDKPKQENQTREEKIILDESDNEIETLSDTEEVTNMRLRSRKLYIANLTNNIIANECFIQDTTKKINILADCDI